MHKHRCTGLLVTLLVCLSITCSGQSPEQLLEQDDPRAAALGFAARGTRLDDFKAGIAWSQIDSITQARAAFSRVVSAGAPDSLTGLAFHKMGLGSYNDYNEPQAVLDYTKAINVRDQVFSGAHKDRAHSRLNLAQTLIELGKNDTAAVILQQAIDIYANASPTDSLNWVRSYNRLALLAEDARDYQVGINAVSQSTAMISRLTNPSLIVQFDTWYAAGRVYLIFGALKQADKAAAQALALANQTGYADLMVDALSLAAGIATEQEDYTGSLKLHEQALSLSEDLELPASAIGLVHFNLALNHGRLNNISRALYHSEAALEGLQDDTFYLPRLHSVRGDIFRRAGKSEAAKDAFNTGIALVAGRSGQQLHYPDPAAMEPNQLEILADLLQDRADVLETLGDTEGALNDYTLLFAVQDNLRSRVTSDESRSYLSKNLRPAFDRAIALEFRKYKAAPDTATAWRAFALSERAKAYSLLSAVQRDRATMPRREAALRARIAALERNTSTDATQRLAAARLQLDRLIRLSGEDDDRSIPEFSAKALRDYVQEYQTALVAFHVGADQGFRWLILPDGNISLASITGVNALPSDISDWRTAITTSAYRRKSLRATSEQIALDEAFMSHGHALYQQLFSVSEKLPEQLCILPDGPLTVLPFGALPTAKVTPPFTYDQLSYLQSDRTLHYAYSARILLQATYKPAADYTHDLLAMAPEFRGSTPAAALTRAVVLRDGERALTGLAPLQYNQPEVEEITALVPASISYFGATADREHFLEQLDQAKIIHLSTHGVVNIEQPALSFVAFSQLGDSLEYEEMLYYNDLSALPISAELAVLSACETSLGTYVPGETSLSLASAFTAAGARSTLTTLWQVDDAATKELMVNFYQELTSGKDRIVALASAQQQHLQSQEYAHPFYWSAITLYGKAGPISFKTGGIGGFLNNTFTPYLAVIVVGLFVGLLLLKRQKEK